MISLDTISRFNGTGNVLLNTSGTDLESVGVKQSLKSFFNVGDARDRNNTTMSAIRDAVFNDPRFKSRDLKDRAKLLLDGVRTDRAIDASRIKGIVKELLALVDGTDSALNKRVDLHLAAGNTDLRGCAAQYVEQVAFVARQHVRKVARDAITAAVASNPLVKDEEVEVNVAGAIKNAFTQCCVAIGAVSNLLEANTRDLADFVGKNLDRFVLNEDGTLRSKQELEDVGEFCRLASRGGYRWLRTNNPAFIPEERELAKPYEMAAVEFLAAVGKPVKPALYQTIEQLVNDQVMGVPFRNFSVEVAKRKAYTADDIQRKITDVMAEMFSRLNGNPNLRSFVTDVFGDKDVKSFEALSRYVAKLLASRLSQDTSKVICAKLGVQTVGEAFENTVRNIIAHDLYQTTPTAPTIAL